jgi:HPt (histidine-containing phosphotransfer) domain-containing protein
VQGDTWLYRSLLCKFRDNQTDFGPRFDAARKSSDTDTATRLAHTLKSTAGTLGALALQAVADELEKACSLVATLEQLTPLADQTQRELDAILAGLQIIGRTQGDAASKAAALKPEEVQARLIDLQTLIQDCDAEAQEVSEMLLNSCLGSPLEAPARALAEALSHFDFDRSESLVLSLMLAVRGEPAPA